MIKVYPVPRVSRDVTWIFPAMVVKRKCQGSQSPSTKTQELFLYVGGDAVPWINMQIAQSLKLTGWHLPGSRAPKGNGKSSMLAPHSDKYQYGLSSKVVHICHYRCRMHEELETFDI